VARPCVSPSRRVKHTTIGCVRPFSAHCFPKTMLLADRGYDADWIRELARQQGAWANIPPKRNRKDPICFSPYLYRAHNLIERFFNKIKQCRRVASRYDKLAANYLAFVKLASIRIWLRANESAPFATIAMLIACHAATKGADQRGEECPASRHGRHRDGVRVASLHECHRSVERHRSWEPAKPLPPTASFQAPRHRVGRAREAAKASRPDERQSAPVPRSFARHARGL
jgi:transposase